MVFDIGTVLSQWEAFGVFDFLLPFLLIFAVVFGILTATNILGGNRGINLTIALVIGLLALRLEFVQVFFSDVFPRLGVGIASMLAIVILTAIFIPKEHAKGWFVTFSILALIGGIIIVLSSFNEQLGFNSSGWWYEYGGLIILAILLIAAIVAIALSPYKGGDGKPATFAPFRSTEASS